MAVKLPDPKVQAAQEAQSLGADRQLLLRTPIDRVLADAPQVDERLLLEGIEAFHAERMARVPSAAKYPESPPWVEHILAVNAELKRLANLTDREMAIYRSLHEYLTFRGFVHAPVRDEKCRAAYLPDTDRGEMMIGNVDDPLTHWKPDVAAPKALPGGGPLAMVGVGNGLHIDDEPDEIFPLPAAAMLPHYAGDVPSGVEFLTRYCPFWGRCNVMLMDRQKRSCAIEKCSFRHLDVFQPDGGPQTRKGVPNPDSSGLGALAFGVPSDGKSHISGMTCRDPGTVQGRHQRAKRQQYLDLFGIPADCPDNAFWAACRKFEDKLASGLRQLGPRPRFDDAVKLFVTPWPEGLNKTGLVLHPRQGLVGYTLQTHISLLAEKKYLRWQRSRDGKTYSSGPEVYQF